MANFSDEFLTAEQDNLISATLAREGIDVPIPSVKASSEAMLTHDSLNRYQPFPLTDIQRGYWLGRGTGFELGNVSCYGYVEIDCKQIDSDRFESAIQTTVYRHDMLRAYILDDGRQQIAKTLRTPMVKRIDLSFMADMQREAERLAIRKDMSQQVLDVSTAPLFDVRLSLGPQRSARIHFGIDSIICDQAGLSIILRDMVTAYEDTFNLFPVAGIQFRSYVLALEKAKSAPARERAKTYWMDRLETLSPAPQIPLAQPYRAISIPTFDRVETSLSTSEWSTFQKMAARISVTSSVALAAAFVLTLKRWCHQDQMTLNLTIFDRQPLHPKLSEIVGDFTSTILLDVDVSASPFFDALCKHVQSRLMKDLENVAFSGVEVLRELSRKKGRLGEALMPVVFTSTIGLWKIKNSCANKGDNTEIPPSFGEKGYTLSQTPQVALDHQLFERSGRLFINWDYCIEAFPEGLIADMFESYISLVRYLASSKSDWKQILSASLPEHQIKRRAEYNDVPAPDAPKGDLLISGFIRNVTIAPELKAILSDSISLTYKDVSILAESLACYLEEKGVKQGDSVIIAITKGWEQCVAALAVSAIGAVYVPISIDTPTARLQAIQRLLSAKAIIGISSTYASDCGVPFLNFSDATKLYKGELSVREHIDPSCVAYVIFTSGSTGTPKGVVITHRSVMNTIHDVNSRFGITGIDRVLALSAFEFDLSVYDLFGMLTVGGALVLPDSNKLRDPSHWTMLMNKHCVSLWNTTPAMLQMLSAYLHYHTSEVPNSLRMTWLSGDSSPINIPASIRQHWPEIFIISMGGATEASIWSIYYTIKKVNPSWDSIPYGMPLGGQKIHVLDSNMAPSPEWTPGEIYISGNGVALGYQNDSKQTNDYFLSNPENGELLYRTGDLGWYHPHGYVVFLGREDQQVKINGFRVELGEIENALLQSSDVKEAVAVSTVVTEESTASRMLAAFVTPNLDSPPIIFTPPRYDKNTYMSTWAAVLKAGKKSQNDSPTTHNGAWAKAWFNELKTLSLVFMNAALHDLGVLSENGTPQSIGQLISQCGVLPRYNKLITQWCDYLTKAGWLTRSSLGYKRISAGPTRDACKRALLNVRSRASDNASLQILTRFYEECGDSHVQLLRGEIDPLELLFPTSDWSIARSLYEEQPIARYLNSIIAEVVIASIKGYGKKNMRFLEIGAGTGATTYSVLSSLHKIGVENNIEYVFSDISQLFLTNAMERFAENSSFKAQVLDINTDFTIQGVGAASQDVVIAVNVLHDAVDLRFTLLEILETLTPGGILVFTEGFAYHPVLAISVGFIEGLSSFSDEREKHGSPLLSEEEWKKRLSDAGFAEHEIFPDNNHEIRGWGQAVIIARSRANGFGPLDVDKARALVGQYTPEYMIPAMICSIPRMPITSNGKLDRKALAAKVRAGSLIVNNEHVNPKGEIEIILAKIWKEGLGLDTVSTTANLFTLGGDSLFAVQMNNRISDVFEISIPLVNILRDPTISAIATQIEIALHEDLNVTEAS